VSCSVQLSERSAACGAQRVLDRAARLRTPERVAGAISAGRYSRSPQTARTRLRTHAEPQTARTRLRTHAEPQTARTRLRATLARFKRVTPASNR